MYTITKTFEVSGSHHLDLNYESKCSHLHGHNWKIIVKCQSEELNECGMVIDFSHIKKEIQEKLDHQHLNSVLPFNPTAENIAHWICCRIPHCVKVTVIESEGNEATYEP